MKLLKVHVLQRKFIPNKCLYQCRNNTNEHQNISNKIKAALKTMATKQGLYAQVVTIRRRESDNENEIEKIKKYNFQRKSSRSRRWFDLDHERLEENFKTRGPDFYRKLHPKIFRGDDTKTNEICGAPIGSTKTIRKV